MATNLPDAWDLAGCVLLLIPALYGVRAAGPRLTRPRAATPPAPDFEVEILTAQQADILRLMALGLTSEQIAEERGTSRRTVETQRKHIMETIHASDRRMMVSFAIGEGLLQPPAPEEVLEAEG